MKTRKNSTAHKRPTAKRTSGKKSTKSKTRSHATRKTATKRPPVHKGKNRNLIGEETYLFECTRHGCGYRIVREEKFEQGQLRFDLKCPKCHNSEFRCLGPGDLPKAEAMELTIPTAGIDLDNISPVELGSK